MKFSESLKKNRDFQYVYRNGRSFANKYFIMYVLENNQDRNYIGIEGNEQYCVWAEKRLEMAEKEKRIQGYEDGIFYDRNM